MSSTRKLTSAVAFFCGASSILFSFAVYAHHYPGLAGVGSEGSTTFVCDPLSWAPRCYNVGGRMGVFVDQFDDMDDDYLQSVRFAHVVSYVPWSQEATPPPMPAPVPPSLPPPGTIYHECGWIARSRILVPGHTTFVRAQKYCYMRELPSGPDLEAEPHDDMTDYSARYREMPPKQIWMFAMTSMAGTQPPGLSLGRSSFGMVRRTTGLIPSI